MNRYLALDDVLLVPKFSFIKSRKDVDTSTFIAGQKLKLGVISSNMDTVTGSEMANATQAYGAASCLHRFQTIQDNVDMYKASPKDTWVSLGLGSTELERAKALSDAGAWVHVIDVAHGSSMEVVNQTKRLLDLLPDYSQIVVGNFATCTSIKDFNYHLGKAVSAYKCGIGGGSVCVTREKTGCGLSSFSSLQSCVVSGMDIIWDGGVKNSGDMSKCFALGAKAVMIGRMLAGCKESPGDLVLSNTNYYKKYRGSASSSSYDVQNKKAAHRTEEGEETLVPYTGTVKESLQKLEAGLRSCMSYCNASMLEELKNNAEFVEITNNGKIESGPHGKL